MQHISIGSKIIGENFPCFIIAEIGLNHNGSVELAKRLIDVAKETGCDCVKFQKRHVDGLAVGSVLDAEDNRFPSFGKTYRQIREHLELSREEYQELLDYAEQRDILFLCTAFDIPSVEFLENLGVLAYKTASHSVTNLPLMRKLVQAGKPVILSSGMCELEEFDEAVSILRTAKTPLAVMHCVSSYPQAPEESNLKMLDVLSGRYQVPVGYSGHEMGFLPTVLAVARGAKLVERHITLDKTMVGFDHKLSLEPQELQAMVREIRQAEAIVGTGEKFVSERERITRNKYHVSIVSACDIPAGSLILESMLEFKNPGTGLPYSKVKEVVQRKARVLIPKDTLLTMDMLDGK